MTACFSRNLKGKSTNISNWTELQLSNFPFCVNRVSWATLKKTPVSFKVDALGGATFTLGFDEKAFKYTLSVDETPFDDLPEFKEKVQAPEVGHSVPDRYIGSTIHRKDFPVFLKGRKNPVSIE